jgi:hypothetical protein
VIEIFARGVIMIHVPTCWANKHVSVNIMRLGHEAHRTLWGVPRWRARVKVLLSVPAVEGAIHIR